MAFDLIYLESDCAGFHTGHIRIFIERAISDPRVNSIHFVVAPDFVDYAYGTPVELARGSHKITYEYLSEEFCHGVSARVGALRRGLSLWRHARYLVSKRPGSVCFINLFDNAIVGAVFDRCKMNGFVTGIIHAPPVRLAKRRPISGARRWASKMASYLLASRAALPVVFTFDDKFMKGLPRFISRSWRYVPDPVPLPRDRLLAVFRGVEASKSGGDKMVLLIFGSLGRRKGIFTLLEALHLLPQDVRGTINIVIAGVFSEASPAEIEQFHKMLASAMRIADITIQYTDKFLSNEELIDAINRCDVILAPYADHVGVSSVLLWAAAGGKPVISQDSGWMGQVVEEESLGFTCNAMSPRSLALAIAQVVKPGALDKFDTERLKAFAKYHSADDFYEKIVIGLDQFLSHTSARKSGRA